LDLLVSDVIRSAVSGIRLGGPFWNREGLEVLRPVIEPALQLRSVACSLYAQSQGEPWDAIIREFARAMHDLGDVRLWWYRAKAGSLLHAKFCVADSATGYFGSANLTSAGLGNHVEIGVKLSTQQCQELNRVLDLLLASGLLEEEPLA